VATVTVATKPGHAFATSIVATGHTFLADEPTDASGDGLGPTPYELLLAALGSCTAMTVAGYARRKAWPLEAITIRLSHDRVHAADCADCDQPASRIDRITREITLTGGLDDAQRARLMEIAAKCPVHRTLLGTPRIEDALVNAYDDRART
jgi:putative redox protein